MARFRQLVFTMICLALIAPPLIAPPLVLADGEQHQPLQGSVKSIDIEAGECLRQMGDADKKMKRAMLELMAEATRQNYISVGDPDVVGTIILPALPVNMMATGPYLALRPRWVDYYIDQVGRLIPIYADLTDSLVMPPSVKDQASVLLDQMRPLFLDAKAHYDELVAMAKDLKNTHNDKVAMTAVMVHDDFEKIDKLRLQVFSLLKESEKHS